jgi:UDP-glucose 6-dehydrogenase
LALANTAVAAPELEHFGDIDMLTVGADAVILSTDAPEYLLIDWERVSRSMRGDIVFDARNALDAEAVRRTGLRYTGYGRRPDRL